MLETPKLVHTLGGSTQKFLKKKIFLVQLELLPVLEIGHLAYTCARDFETWYTPWEDQLEHFLKKIFLVRLELVHVLNGLTCARDSKLGTHLGGEEGVPCKHFWRIFFVPVLNGLT